MHVIGLTGGIATGKSTVSAMLRALGAPVVDADVLAREVVLPGTDGFAEIARRWPDVVTGGALDRKALGARVFSSADDRAALNAITHPRIAALTAARFAELRDAGAPVAIYDAALIVENGLHRGLDELVVVTAAPEQQLARLVTRDGLTVPEARARIASQLPLSEKVALATRVVDNSGSLAETRAQVLRLWKELHDA